MTSRKVWIRLHRYAGLAMALFLTIAGLTGSMIAFNHELDEWLNPELFHVSSRGAPLPSLEIAGRVEQSDPRLRVTWVPLQLEIGHAVGFFVEPRIDRTTGQPFAVEYNQVFIDPVTGAVLGKRFWGAFRLDRAHLIPFLYVLHYSLHLPERWGIWLMGIVGLVWVFDCFVGLYLTFPHRQPFLEKWKPAWQVKRGAGAWRINFDLHRAGGLWFWGLLLIMAVSSVSLNLNQEVFRPVVSFFSPLTPTPFEQREERPPEKPIEPVLSFEEILAKAKDETQRRDWDTRPYGLFYSSPFGVFGVVFGEEHAPGLGSSWLYFDGEDGRLIGGQVPGQGTSGDLFIQLQFPLHSGQIAGLPGRIVIFITGIVVAMLSVTGVVIWLKKRRSRQVRGAYSPLNEPARHALGTVSHEHD
jgi:uncharacterized iron-regulated membrane protein